MSINSFLTGPFTGQMSWLVISNILIFHFLLNSYIENIPDPDTKGEKKWLLLNPWKSFWKQFQMLTLTKAVESDERVKWWINIPEVLKLITIKAFLWPLDSWSIVMKCDSELSADWLPCRRLEEEFPQWQD